MACGTAYHGYGFHQSLGAHPGLQSIFPAVAVWALRAVDVLLHGALHVLQTHKPLSVASCPGLVHMSNGFPRPSVAFPPGFLGQ